MVNAYCPPKASIAWTKNCQQVFSQGPHCPGFLRDTSGLTNGSRLSPSRAEFDDDDEDGDHLLFLREFPQGAKLRSKSASSSPSRSRVSFHRGQPRMLSSTLLNLDRTNSSTMNGTGSGPHSNTVRSITLHDQDEIPIVAEIGDVDKLSGSFEGEQASIRSSSADRSSSNRRSNSGNQPVNGVKSPPVRPVVTLAASPKRSATKAYLTDPAVLQLLPPPASNYREEVEGFERQKSGTGVTNGSFARSGSSLSSRSQSETPNSRRSNPSLRSPNSGLTSPLRNASTQQSPLRTSSSLKRSPSSPKMAPTQNGHLDRSSVSPIRAQSSSRSLVPASGSPSPFRPSNAFTPDRKPIASHLPPAARVVMASVVATEKQLRQAISIEWHRHLCDILDHAKTDRSKLRTFLPSVKPLARAPSSLGNDLARRTQSPGPSRQGPLVRQPSGTGPSTARPSSSTLMGSNTTRGARPYGTTVNATLRGKYTF